MWHEGHQWDSSNQQEAALESSKMYITLNMQMCCKTGHLMLKCYNREEAGEAGVRETPNRKCITNHCRKENA